MSGYGDQSSMVEVLSDEEYEARRKAEEEETSRSNSSNTSTGGYGQNKVQIEDSPQVLQEEPTTYETYVKPWVDTVRSIPDTIRHIPTAIGAMMNPESPAVEPLPDYVDTGASLATDAVVGGVSGIQNVGEAVGGAIAEPLIKAGALDRGDYQKAKDRIDIDQSYKPTNEFAYMLGQVAAPSMIGGGAGTMLMGSTMKATEAPAFIAYLGRLTGNVVGSSLGYTVSKESGKDRMIVGDTSSLNWMDKPFSDESKLGQMGNDFVDALVIAYPAATAIDVAAMGVMAVYNLFGRPILTVGSGMVGEGTNNLKLEVMENIAGKMGVFRNAVTDQEKRKALLDIAEYTRKNSKLIFEDENGVAQSLTKDTFSAIQEGVDPESYIFRKLNELKRGHIDSGHATEFSRKVSEPVNAFEKVSKGVENKLGGMPGIEKSERGVQQLAKTKVDMADAMVDTAEKNILQKETSLGSLFEEDPAFADTIKKLGKKENIDVYKLQDQSIDKLRDVARKTYDKMKKTLDDLVDKIPDFRISLEEGTMKDFLESSLISEDIKKSIRESGGSFKQLYKKVVPKISNEISSNLERNRGSVETLKNLKDFIHNGGNAKSTAAIQKVRDYYAKEWAPLWRDGKLESFGNVYRSTQAKGPLFEPTNYNAETEAILKSALRERYYTEQLSKLLKSPVAKSDPKLITDYYMGQVASELQSHINITGSLKGFNVKSAIKPLQESRLYRVDPEAAKRVNSFLKKFNTARNDIDTMKEELKTYVAIRDEVKNGVYKDTFSNFFTGEMPTKKGFETFKKLFGEQGNLDKIKTILEEARDAGDTETINGLRAAWIRSMRGETLSKESLTYGGGKAVKGGAIEAANEGETHLFRYGDILFEDQPLVLNNLKNLLGYSEKIQTSVGKGGKEVPFSASSVKNAGSGAIDQVITFTRGALDRIGARLRSAKGALLRKLDPTKNIEGITDSLISNPEEAEKMLLQLAESYNKKDREAIRQGLLSLTTFLVGDKISNNELTQVVDDVQNQLDPQANRETDKLLERN